MEREQELKTAETRRILEISRTILDCPTAPFHEKQVIFAIKRLLEAHRIPFVQDSGGNLIARLTRGRVVRPVAFVSHTDHPGIHLTGMSGGVTTGEFLGGVDHRLMNGVAVDLFLKKGSRIRGKITGVKKNRKTGKIRLRLSTPEKIQPGDFGMFALPGWRVRGDKIYSRAIDDLIGCAAILNALIRLKNRAIRLNVFGVFTRAEETGFVGAQHLAAQESIPGDALVISVESSKAFSYAEMGGGPVLRVGDRASLFSPDADLYVQDIARSLIGRIPGFKYQRRLMSGGTCEATPFSLSGFQAYGIAFPLGNYHNMASGGKIRAEYVAISDFLNGIGLIEEIAAGMPGYADCRAALAKRLIRRYLQSRRRLLKEKEDFF